MDLSVIARGTPGFAGADLANLVNEAALVAARQNRKVVTQVDFELAKDKVLMGVERKSLIISDKEKRMTAYHEAGHALVAASMEHADPLHKVTIIPRGMALGLTMQLPLDDKLSHDKLYLEARLAILMAGRIAEEIFLNQITTGAGNDIERATEMAHKMVCEWGMSELGPMSFGKKEEQIFLGREINQHRDYSESTAIEIDKQVRKLVESGYSQARVIITEKSDALVRIAEALLEREVLDGAEVLDLIAGKTLPEVRSNAAGRRWRRLTARHYPATSVRLAAGPDRRRESAARLKSQPKYVEVRRGPGDESGPLSILEEMNQSFGIPTFPVYLFDVDGTLFHSAPDICGAIQTVLAKDRPARMCRKSSYGRTSANT